MQKNIFLLKNLSITRLLYYIKFTKSKKSLRKKIICKKKYKKNKYLQKKDCKKNKLKKM